MTAAATACCAVVSYCLGRFVAWSSVSRCRSFLGLRVVSPRVRPRRPCLLPRLGIVRDGGGCRGRASCLRVAVPRYAYRPVPHIEERGDISRFGCLSRSCLLVDDGIGERAFIVDDIVLVGGRSDNPNIVAVVGKDIGGLVGINLVIPIDVHRELLNDLTNRDTLARDIAIANSNAVGLANENIIGLNEVDGLREIVSGHLDHHFGFLSSAPFRHL